MIQMISTLTSIDQSEFSGHRMNTLSLSVFASLSLSFIHKLTHTVLALFVPCSAFLSDTNRQRVVFKEALSLHKSAAGVIEKQQTGTHRYVLVVDETGCST